jgi:ribonuclease HI
MELMAVVQGLLKLKEPCDVELYSDSAYVVNSINNWLKDWIKKDFYGVKNVDLWKEFLAIKEGHNIYANWIKAHNGHPENERCDFLAREEAMKVVAFREN